MNIAPSVGFCVPMFMHWNAHPIGPCAWKMQLKIHVHFSLAKHASYSWQHIVSRQASHCPESGDAGGHTTTSPVLSPPSVDSDPDELSPTVDSPPSVPVLVAVVSPVLVDSSTTPDVVDVVPPLVPLVSPALVSPAVVGSAAPVSLVPLVPPVVGVVIGGATIVVPPVSAVPALSSPHPTHASPRSTTPRSSRLRMSAKVRGRAHPANIPRLRPYHPRARSRPAPRTSSH